MITPIHPCGTVRDMMRSCYTARMRVWRDQPQLMTVQWMRADKDAKWPDTPWRFRSRYTWMKGEPWGYVGEQEYVAYSKGNDAVGYLGQHACGSDEAWRAGGRTGVDPVLTVEADGRATCCPIVDLDAEHGVELGGAATQGGQAFVFRARGGLRFVCVALQGFWNRLEAEGGLELGRRATIAVGPNVEGGLELGRIAQQGQMPYMLWEGGISLGGEGDQGQIPYMLWEGGISLGREAQQGPVPVYPLTAEGGIEAGRTADQGGAGLLVAAGGLELGGPAEQGLQELPPCSTSYQYTTTVAGVSGTSCGGANRTWVLSNVAGLQRWNENDGAGSSCELRLTSSPYRVTVATPGGRATFETTDFDCLLGGEFTFVSSVGGCSGWPASVTVTKV